MKPYLKKLALYGACAALSACSPNLGTIKVEIRPECGVATKTVPGQVTVTATTRCDTTISIDGKADPIVSPVTTGRPF